MKFVLGLLLLFLSSSSLASDTFLVSDSQIISLALGRGIEAELAGLDTSKSTLGIQSAKSIYDTLLKANAKYEQDKNQKTTPLFGTDNKTTNFGAELQQKTPLGSTLSAGFANQRDQTNSAFTTLPDLFSTQIYASIRQPLAKNFLGYIDRKSIELAKNKASALGHQAQARLQGYIFKCLVAYWQLYLTHHNYLLEQEAYNKAVKLFEANKNKKDLGLIEDADLFNFATNRDSRKSLLLQAEMDKIKAEETLAQELNIYPQKIKLAAGKNTFTKKNQAQIDTLIATALTHRADYQAQKATVQAQSIELKMAKNKLWPELDLIGSYNLNGVDSQYAQSLENIGGNHPKWQVGMELSIPFQNRASRSEVKLNSLNKKEQLLELKKIENSILNQIRTSLANYQLQYKKLLSLDSALIASQKRREAELERFNQGRSDSNAVLQAEADFVDVKKMRLQAQMGFKFAEVDLIYAQGKILE